MRKDYSSLSTEQRIQEAFKLYESFGDADYIGEPVSQMEHMCQAAQLAEAEGYDDTVVLAALFHDIGHLFAQQEQLEEMGGFGVLDHEKIGADFLRDLGFPELMAKLVESHVEAKRYLTFRYPEYFQKLSEASKQTLSYQGGVMTAEEAAAFEADPDHPLILKMREWDEKAKEMSVPLPDLDGYKSMARSILSSN
ncbi:MAG: HD domain-containing protein [Lunatimonas sp.]|uniref:phosphonate degradation HD-domain oxygenase n=1 Tax=Lunatimonas sp. TaxID=2060141 RepID=UPI00263AB310|nr:phosphonate degradation HD-domain oxygenase [Lunatimonas sp.]MCC5937391.1 HD domain-containing protein [Lunatimonas sp.]